MKLNDATSSIIVLVVLVYWIGSVWLWQRELKKRNIKTTPNDRNGLGQLPLWLRVIIWVPVKATAIIDNALGTITENQS